MFGVFEVATQRDNSRRLRVVDGRTTIHFFPSVLQANGLRLTLKSTAEGDPNSGEQTSGFKFANADLRYTIHDLKLSRFDGGSLQHVGGYQILSGRKSINGERFRISPVLSANNALNLSVGSGKSETPVFELANMRPIYMRLERELVVSSIDLILTDQAAQLLDRPELAGKLLGTMTIYADSKPVDGLGDIEDPGTHEIYSSAPIDVALSAMGSLTALGRVGTYPNGKNGLSMSTTSCNVGTQQIPWSAPMNVQHPAIAMNLYRLKDGKFEQIGWSWMKHGFFATNSSGCGSCSPSGTGSLLGVGCSDTYGTGNNGDRNYLGGRDEINPYTGIWTCQNSYFSNYINDCVRRNNGSGLDPVQHRLEVLDADLGNANSQYFYEAYYINGNDFDKYNNIASRVATMTWSGTSWNITTTAAAQVQGPAINRWGEMRSTTASVDGGDVIVAVQTTDIGGGNWHYEYAVYNHDSDRQVREFSIPVPEGATVQNIGFRDIDQDGTNQWSGSFAGGKITWSTGSYGSSTANSLKFASVFNFRFDVNVRPVNGTATLGLFKPGTDTSISAATKSPMVLSPLSAFQPENASVFSGSLASMATSNGDALELGPTNEGARSGSGLTGSITAPSATVNSLTLGVESRNSLASGAGGTQQLWLWNWSTLAWELVDTRAVTLADSVALVTISSNASRFVEPSTKEVRLKLIHQSAAGSTGNRWRMFLDQVGFHFG